MAHVHDVHRPRNLTINDEGELNDIWHQIGCNCPECRPDLHDFCEPIAHDGFGSPEAA